MITSLSPLKKARSTGSQYFDGELCDGTQTLRFVGFSAHHKKQLDDLHGLKAGFLERLSD